MPSDDRTARQCASALDEVLGEAVRATGAHISVLYLMADRGELLLMDAEMGLPAQIARPWTRVRLNAAAPATVAVQQRRLVWVPDHEEMARRYPSTALALPYRFAVASAPIESGDHVWGCWSLLWPQSRPRELTPHELEVITLSSKKMADLLEQAAESGHPVRPAGMPRVIPPMRRREPDPGIASAASDYVDRLREGCVTLDLEGRITFVNPMAAELLGGDVTELLGKLLWEVTAWLQEPLFEDRCRAAVVSQEVTCCVAHRPDGRRLEFQLFPDPTGISLRLTLAPPEEAAPPHPPVFGARDLSREDVFYNFVPFAAALTRALKVQEIIDLFADHIMPVVKVQAMAVVIAEGGKLKIVGSCGYDREVLDRFDGVPLALPTPAERVMRTGEPAFFSSPDELRQLYPYAAQHDRMSSWAFLPIGGSDGTAGACVLAFDEPRSFTGEDRAGLTTLTELISQALDRALLYDAKERLAHGLQETLLPRRLPEIPRLAAAARYLPATHGVDIGGDFYDLIRLDDTAMAVIGDVQGHNITAAALMGQVRTAVRTHTAAGVGPGEALTYTNRLLIETETELFTSCLLVHVDLRLRTLRAASAGHPPPLLRPPNAPGEVIDVPVGPPLGVDDGACYPTLVVPFPPGALLALYTDGLVETPRGDLDQAIGALAGLLTGAAGRPPQELADILLNHAPHTAQRADDIALLVLEHLV
ncbi:SpoIIE family protein phosphatase [Nonomuraea terrae]|uniref:SpoIIE family protein phosphatase n=1 Tax=Nonomuraea terrae TaxID=2530383 RepID=UPI0037ACB617